MEFSQIAILIVAAGIFGVIARTLKQPLLIGYLFAGLALGIAGLVSDIALLESLGSVGVALLLFLLGLEMKLSELPAIGKTALLTGCGQIIFTSSIGFLISLLLGFGFLPSIYIAIAITFSSTIIMVKLLSEKKDLGSLYGRIAIGFLLVQDFVAVIILMFLSGLGGDFSLTKGNLITYLIVAARALFLFIFVWGLSKKLLPRLFDKVARQSHELLFIVSIAWALGMSAFVADGLGFSLEIGGFLAGIALSNLPEHLQIASKTKSLRDFFLTIFFLLLGTRLVMSGGILAILPSAIILSLFVLVGNPVIVMAIMGLLGYKKRTSFLAGLTVAQISEFSLILMSMGLVLGHVQDSHVAMIVLVGVITMTISTYVILGSDKVYKKIKGKLGIFERKRIKEAVFQKERKMNDHIVLVGCDRTGKVLCSFFLRRNISFVVVDFNPKVFKKLSADKIPVVFGDINEPEVFDAANVIRSRMVISTTSNLIDNLTMLEHMKSFHKKPITIFSASTKHDAISLYEKGVTYLIVPEMTAGEHIKHLLESYGYGNKRFVKLGQNHFNRLVYK
jgi:Kef-type K+ transport system membrane component KefB